MSDVRQVGRYGAVAGSVLLLSLLTGMPAVAEHRPSTEPPGALAGTGALEGRFEGAPPPEFVLRQDHQEQKRTPEANARVRFVVEIAGPTYVELRLGSQRRDSTFVYLLPGQVVSFTCQAADLRGSIRFSGAGALENGILSELMVRYAGIDRRKLFLSRPAEFVNLLQAEQRSLESALDQAVASHPDLDARFVRFERARVQYFGALLRVRRLGLSGDWDAFAAGLDFNDPTLLGVDTYAGFLYEYTKARGQARLAIDAALQRSINQQTEARYVVARETFTDPIVRGQQLYEVIRNHFVEEDDGPFGCRGIDDLVARFARDSRDRRQRAEVERRYRDCVEGRNAPIIRPYRVASGVSLDAHVFPAAGARPGDKRAAYVFFHGGGWAAGMPEWGYGQCRHYAERGLVGISFEYRLRWRHGTSPLEAVQDAKSAVRWVRAHAGELGVDPDRIVVAGFSAGGHLAAATALVPRYDPADDQSISAVPSALILISAAVDVAENNWFRECLAGRGSQRELSPSQQIQGRVPPTIAFHGREDPLCPYAQTVAFCDKVNAVGNRCELHSFPGGHFRSGQEWQTVNARADVFLASLGFLQPVTR